MRVLLPMVLRYSVLCFECSNIPASAGCGNEAPHVVLPHTQGVSEETLALADGCAVIPMAGFVESLNVSIAAALTLYEARSARERLLGCHGDLTPEEQETLKAVMFLRHTV